MSHELSPERRKAFLARPEIRELCQRKLTALEAAASICLRETGGILLQDWLEACPLPHALPEPHRPQQPPGLGHRSGIFQNWDGRSRVATDERYRWK